MSSFQKIPLSELIEPRSEQVMPDPKVELNYVGLEHIESSKFTLEEFGSSKEVRSSKFKFYPNNILYGKLRPYLDKAVLINDEGICSTDIYVFQVKNRVNPKYLLSLIHSKRFRDFVNSTTAGMNLPRTSWRKMKDFCFLVPHRNGTLDLKEQKRIAAKIDKLFAEIDKGIEKTKRALEDSKKLLKSELSDVFNQGLSRGWRLVEFGDNKYFNIETGSTPKTSVKKYWVGGDIVWVTPKDLGQLKGRIVKDSSRKITRQGLLNSSASIVPKGSIIISTRAPIGYVAITGLELCFNQGCKAVVMKSPKLNSEFLFYAALISVDSMKDLGKGSTFSEISKKKLGSIAMFLPFKKNEPDLVEQKKIARRLDKIKNESEKLQEKYEEQLNNFGMLKQSILNQAFQGKL